MNFQQLFDRVKRILLSPRDAWAAIDADPTNPLELYKGYVMPLAAILPVAQVVGWIIFRPWRYLGSTLLWAVVTYLLTLGGVFILALVIDALAPSFGSQRDQSQALKVAAYSGTAMWVAGVFTAIPHLSWLGVLGLYSLYLLYLGLPLLMKAPEDKALAYVIAVIFVALVLFLVIGLVAANFVSPLS